MRIQKAFSEMKCRSYMATAAELKQTQTVNLDVVNKIYFY